MRAPVAEATGATPADGKGHSNGRKTAGTPGCCATWVHRRHAGGTRWIASISLARGGHDGASATVRDLAADVRLIGVLPVPAIFLKNVSLDNIMTQVRPNAQYEVTDEEFEGRRTAKLAVYDLSDNTVNITYWFSHDDGGMPLEIKEGWSGSRGSGQSKVAVRSRSTWQAIEDLARPGVAVRVPTETVIQRYEDDQLVLHERVTIHKVECGVPPQDMLFQWEGMDLPDRYAVRYSDGNAMKTKQWNANARSFGPWTPEVIRVDASRGAISKPASRTASTVVMIHVAAIVGLVVALCVLRRRRRHS